MLKGWQNVIEGESGSRLQVLSKLSVCNLLPDSPSITFHQPPNLFLVKTHFNPCAPKPISGSYSCQRSHCKTFPINSRSLFIISPLTNLTQPSKFMSLAHPTTSFTSSHSHSVMYSMRRKLRIVRVYRPE